MLTSNRKVSSSLPWCLLNNLKQDMLTSKKKLTCSLTWRLLVFLAGQHDQRWRTTRSLQFWACTYRCRTQSETRPGVSEQTGFTILKVGLKYSPWNLRQDDSSLCINPRYLRTNQTGVTFNGFLNMLSSMSSITCEDIRLIWGVVTLCTNKSRKDLVLANAQTNVWSDYTWCAKAKLLSALHMPLTAGNGRVLIKVMHWWGFIWIPWVIRTAKTLTY